VLLLAACSDKEEAPVVDGSPTDIITLNVDVVLPADITNQWQNAIDLALANFDKAQQKRERKISLNLRYHDEHSEDLDQLAFNLTHPKEGDDTCHAIIGPHHSDNAQTFLSYAAQKRLPVVMPTCSSAELQRTNARNSYAWFLTESDITQCEIMLSAAQALQATDVALIYSDDTYGKSFMDWFGYYATERELHIAGGTHAYQPGEDLRPFLRKVVEEANDTEVWLLFALNSGKDYVEVSNASEEFFVDEVLGAEKVVYLRNICADTAMDQTLLQGHNHESIDMGISPCAALNYGFAQAYTGRFSRIPFNGEAQVYDALTIIALGAAAREGSPDRCIVDGKEMDNEPGLTDYMRSVVSSESGPAIQWDAASLAIAFEELAAGRPIDMSGATGNLFFDRDTRTKILNTTYMLWQIAPNYDTVYYEPHPYFEPQLYLSTAGTSYEASTTEFWLLEKKWAQEFGHEDNIPQHHLPKVTDHWAVVISPSTTWNNYRHQADAFAMYQTLRSHGYDDDHIVLIVEDNLAADSRNNYPGQIFVEPPGDPGNSGDSGYDVRQNAVVDYHFSQLHTEDLEDILMGRQSERLPHVIHSDSASNVFVFWSGHGGSKDGPLWGNEDTREYFGTDHLKDIVSRMSGKGVDVGTNDYKKYRRLMLCLETCYSGQWGEALLRLPDVVVLTAANSRETSKADVFDQQMGVFLSNAFTRTFRRMVNDDPAMTFYDLYRQLSRTTNGSHVTLYNENQYGSVYTSTMDDFFPR
jgi:glycosylphosphatidylinositol transamidase (GPIT) subunit GPI8